MQPSRIRQSAEGANGRRPGGVLADLPRRQFIEVSNGDASLSQMRFVSFKVNHLRALASFLRWCQLILNFYFSIFLDIFVRQRQPGATRSSTTARLRTGRGILYKVGTSPFHAS